MNNTNKFQQQYYEICPSFDELFTLSKILYYAEQARKSKPSKKNTLEFMQNKVSNCEYLYRQIHNGTYKPKFGRSMTIIERGHERKITIPSFRDKIVQKMICEEILRPILNKHMVYSNCASIRGKGTDFCFNYLDHMLRSWIDKYGEFGYIVKLDFKSYFASIHTTTLIKELSKYVFDEKILRIIKLFFNDEYGLQLGNELSQIPASFFPNKIDHLIMDNFGCPFIKYMDDSLFLSKTIEDISNILKEVESICESMRLILNQSKTEIIKVGQNFTFCKQNYKFNKKTTKYVRKIPRNTIKRNKTKIKKLKQLFKNNKIKSKDYIANTKCIIGMLNSKPNTKKDVQLLVELSEIKNENNKESYQTTSQ